MSDLRGRPLAWVAVALSIWVGARISMGRADSDEPVGQHYTPHTAASLPSLLPVSAHPPTSLNATLKPTGAAQPIMVARPKFPRLPPALDPWQDGGRPSGLLAPLRVAEFSKPLSTGRDTPPTNAPAPPGKAGQPLSRRRWGAELYAYSFWQFATGGSSALAPGAQYGGSQSGLVATVDPFGDPNRGLALLARGAVTPDGDEREVALGLRWKPDADWPILLSAEQRFRANAPDRFAAYLAGGVDALALTGKWQLDAYGQAGYATGRGGGGFFDAQARITRPLAEVAGVPITLGAGSWAGGQRGSARLDVGPTAVARIDTGPSVIVIQLDWRLRTAGNAEPKDGVALTLSTGF
jgi:hypothetical protein